MKNSVTYGRLLLALGVLGIAGATASGCGGGGGSGTTIPPGSAAVTMPPAQTGVFTYAGNLGARAVCQANPHTNGQARWTVLVYMNGANNLMQDSLLNMAQMAAVGSDGTNLNIVVQWKLVGADQPCGDTALGVSNDCGPAPFSGTNRYYVHPHSAAQVSSMCSSLLDETTCTSSGSAWTSFLAGDLVASASQISTNGQVYQPNDANLPGTLPNGGAPASAALPANQSDMGAYQTLQNFIAWGEANYPADNYALVIWDHGSGWFPIYRTIKVRGKAVQVRTARRRAVSFDDQTAYEIETWELPQALASETRPFDLIAIDCSLQGMVEIAHELRNNGKVLCASEESPPGEGYPYNVWLNDLKNGGANACAVGQSILKDFFNEYPSSTDDITQSMVDLTQMNNVATGIEALAKSLNSNITSQAAVYAAARIEAHDYAPTEGYQDNHDLYNYLGYILNGVSDSSQGLDVGGTTNAGLRQAATNLQSLITGPNGAVMMNARGATQVYSNGLALYIPPSSTYLGSDFTPSGDTTQQDYLKLSLVQAGAAPDWNTFLASQQQ